MKKLISASFALLLTLSLTACDMSMGKSEKAVNVSNITFTDFSKEISADRIYNTIKMFSATDNARITGFEGEKNTSDYIAKQFKDMGLTVEEQIFPIKAYRCSGTEVNIITPENKNITSQFLTFSKETPKEGITADIVFGDMGTQDELEKAQVKGKLVLMKRGGEYYKNKTDRADSLGAVGAIFYDPNQEPAVAATLVQPSNIPAVSIERSEGEKIAGLLGSGKPVKITLKVDSECKDSTSKNIIATMKSKKQSTGKILIVGAHYDGVNTPAANDNASGIATVMEVARAISKEKLDCDVRFIAFGAEEIGLVGSNYYVSNLANKDKNNIIGMINLDMVGAGDTLFIHTMKKDTKSLPADLAVSCVKQFKYKYIRNEQESSDHVPFESAGISVAYFEYGPYHDYHTDKDTIDKIQKDDLLDMCNVVTAMCKEIGKNPEGFSKK